MLKLLKRYKGGGSTGLTIPASFNWNRVSSLQQMSRKRLFIILVLLVSLLVLLGGVIYRQLTRETPAVLPTVQQVDQANLEKLRTTAPPPTASIDKRAAHLDKLALAFAAIGDYKSAATVFDQRISLQSDDLNYYDYIVLARYRHQAADKAGALMALDRAASLLPPDDPNRGYSKASKLSMIDALRKEYSK